MSYRPLYVRKYETGLIQNRVETILPNDAYPVLENAFIFRETIKRRQGLANLGRLQRKFTAASLGLSGASPWAFNIYATLAAPFVPEANAQLVPGSTSISIGGTVLIDNGAGVLNTNPISGVSGTINYLTGDVVITGAGAGIATTITFAYNPNLPVMGLRSRELTSINVEQTIAFDTKYAYNYRGGWQEFIPGTTWTGSDSDFFWSTNYWVSKSNTKIFWVTNFSDTTGDPIRYTDSTAWVDFAPQIDAVGNVLAQARAILPFRGRLVTFNTLEGANLATSLSYPNRIRWAAIGNPFTTVSAIVTTVNANAWRDDIQGQGGYLDIPTSQAIVAVGFVRDNLVIYCERSTWQLRYTGRTIAPFQIEKVNSELGAESTFSAVQFDTSLVGIGDKGIVECDSFKSEKIDIKIPDLVFEFKNDNNGLERVQGIRDLQQRLAYWTYVYNPSDPVSYKYPNRRLIYNYENDSWAIFTDSLTALGYFQNPVSRTWATAGTKWAQSNFPWLDVPAQFPSLIGGTQHGFVLLLSSNLQPKTTNDPTLFISNIIGNVTTATAITSPLHNLTTGQVIKISGIPSNDPFASLNNSIFGIVVTDANTFLVFSFSPSTGDFSIPQLNAAGTYQGGGVISVRDNFRVISKKFNYLDEGQNIQFGYMDMLLDTTQNGEITLNVYLDYNDSRPINQAQENTLPGSITADEFFNVTVPTSQQAGIQSNKSWQRVFCPARGNFITLELTLSNAQLAGEAQESNVKIEGQVIWTRPAGTRLVNV